MVTIIGKLKSGKSTNSFLKAEHILNGSPKLIVHLHLLFNALIQHGYVPTDFLKGTITPTVKDNDGDLNMTDNYRGITLCGTFSHIFENALRLKFGSFLSSDELRFGFKSNHSTSHAAFTLKTCVEHFLERGSNVFVSYLDFTKAFDQISHYGFFFKLMERRVPLCFLLVIIFWYQNMQYNCKWGSSKSDFFSVLCGTKQGGILSPDFFAVYINDLIKILRASGIGCHIVNMFIACILFADDMALLAPTRGSMQELLDICVNYCEKYCLKFNVKKTKVMVIGKLSTCTDSLANLHIGTASIEYVKSYRYLGFRIVSDVKFRFSSTECLRGFFGAVNSVLTITSKPRENMLMQLLYSNCVPKLTYGSAVRDLNSAEKQKYNVAVNNAVRRIFGFRYWQSIRQLREFYGYDSIEIMFAKSRKKFMDSLKYHRNSILRFLSSVVLE